MSNFGGRILPLFVCSIMGKNVPLLHVVTFNPFLNAMMKYPIGIQSFEKLREGGFVYVDKTALVYDLVSNGTVYFLSRSRRFGKSLLVDTLECYFRGRKELFRGLAMESLEHDWHEHPVFKIDFNGDRFDSVGTLEAKIEGHIA